jgi:hypothetical protein
MFREMLQVQYKWSRVEIIFYSLAAFLIPTLVIKIGFTQLSVYSIDQVLVVSEAAGVFYVLLALVCAAAFALRPWLVDSALRHVYALSLPVPWTKFVQMRFVAGALLLIIPTLFIWLGGMLATAAVTIPPTLHAYPGGVALRFAMSALVFYAATFVFQYFSGKHAAKVALVGLLVLVGAELAGRALGLGSAIEAFGRIMTTAPGPFETITARWLLIDV